MFVIIVALWTGNRRWLEIASFWGIGGTLQAIITPNLRFGFPDLRFVSFFVAHCGIIIGIVFLMLVYGFRPRPMERDGKCQRTGLERVGHDALALPSGLDDRLRL